MKFWTTERMPCLLSLLVTIGGMIPPLSICWDEYLVPKWYAGITAVLVCCILLQKEALRRTPISKWISYFAGASAVGIGFQAGYMLLLCPRLNTSGITGTFDAPAGLALTVCLGIAIIAIHLKYNSPQRIHVACYITTILMGIVLIVLSHSRAGLLALNFEFLVLLLYSHIKRWLKIGIILIFTSGICLVVLTSKRDSSIGRAFIIEQTISLILEKPLMGYGFYGFSNSYMPMQQHYFETHNDADVAWLADEIKHPLNEFLLVWVNYGVIATLLLLLVIILPIIVFPVHPLAWINSGVLLIFCLFSYPLNYPITWIYIVIGVGITIYKYFPFHIFCIFKVSAIIIGFCILIALPCDLMQSIANESSQRGKHNQALALYKKSKNLLEFIPFSLIYPFRAPQFFYNYTHELYVMGHLEEAQRMAEKCSKYTNGYNLQLLRGDICQMQGSFAEAATHYINAHYMCPVRFAPLCGLLQVYRQTGDSIKADSIAQVIQTKPVKVPSVTIDEIKTEADDWMKSKCQ